MKKGKCKDCHKWINSVCAFKYKVHSPGKKRFCVNYTLKVVEPSKVPVFRVPWMSKTDKNKVKLREAHDRQKQREMQNILDQQKLVQEGITGPTGLQGSTSNEKGIQGMQGTLILKTKVVKKPNIFQRVLRQKVI